MKKHRRLYALAMILGIYLLPPLSSALEPGKCSNLHNDIARMFSEADRRKIKSDIVSMHDVNCLDTDGRTPLYVASYFGFTQIVNALLNNGAKVGIKTSFGETPINTAAMYGHSEVLRSLLANKGHADIDGFSVEGKWNPLILASANGETQCIETLLLHGADIDRKNIEGNTALMLAAEEGKAGAVSILLKRGASVSIANATGMTANDIAENKKHAEIIEMLASIEPARTTAKNELSEMLVRAVENRALDVVKKLLSQGADWSYLNDSGMNSMHIAAYKGYGDITAFLIKYGVNIETPINDRDKPTPLIIATYSQHDHIVKQLVSNGANVNTTDARGLTPLMLAVEKDDMDMVRYFIEKGADPWVIDNKKRMALNYAVPRVGGGAMDQGNEAIAEYLATKMEPKFIISDIRVTDTLPIRGLMSTHDVSSGILSLSMESGDDFIPITNNEPQLWGNGSLHRYSGRVVIPELHITVFGEGDGDDRLEFLVVKNVGYIYIHGKGRVIQNNGKEVRLGYDSLDSFAKGRILKIQRELKSLGYDPGTIDGIMGGHTVSALKEFQRNHDLPDTGDISADTENLLFN